MAPVHVPAVTEQTGFDAVRKSYSGDLVIGRDLLELKL